MFRTHVSKRSSPSPESEDDSSRPSKRAKGRSKRVKMIPRNSTEIYFNSKSVEYIELADGTLGRICHLSNLFGGVEFDYMAARFTQPEVLGLFDELECCDAQTFLEWLKKLQPGKKWTPDKEMYWFCDGEPIRGILAQMLGTMVRNTPTALKRRKIVAEALGLANIEIKEELSDNTKQRWMEACLDVKFADPKFKSILLATGDAVLHEKPMRGKPNAWSYKWHEDPEKRGGDWLGCLLMRIRNEL